MNIFQNLTNNNTKSYLYSKGNIYSYNQLVQDAEKFSTLDDNRFLIFIVANNSYDSLVGYVGLLRVNKVVAMINDSIHESNFYDLIERFKPRFIYKPLNVFSLKKNWMKKLKIGQYELYETYIEIDYEINDDLALLLMTSGSTGSPEFVKLSHPNIYSNTKSICKYLHITDHDSAITTLPASYSYGISIVNTHLFMGASLILTDSSMVNKSFWNLIEKYKITTFGGVPYTYSILKRLNFENIDLPSLRYITQAGGKLRSGLIDYYYKVCRDKQIDFIVMYGQTEASPRMSYLPPKMLKKKNGSIGVPIPGGEFYLINDRNQIINDSNVEGQLVYKGENVAMGYANNCYDLARGDSNKGVLLTGDMAKVDSDGYYFVTGRKKRFLKLFGNRVSLDQVEQKINEAGYNCACVGVDDFMKIYTDSKSNVETIIKFVKEYFDISKSGFSVISIQEIPRNHSGKILYSELNKN